MPQRNVASNFTFEQQRVEINNLAQDFWSQKGTVDTALPTFLKHDGSNAFTGQTLSVPNAFTINSNSGNGTVTISGNLDVTGTTTTVSSANLEVTDKNILIAKGSTSDAQADGAGITIDSATDITFNFVDAKDALVSSIGLEAATFIKSTRAQFTGAGNPLTGQGLELTAPDQNTGQIASYDRDNTAYKELRLKGSSVALYGGTSNALVGTFNSTGLDVTGSLAVNSGTINTCATFTSSDAGAVINITDNSARSSIEQHGTDLKIISDTDAGNANSTIKFQVDASTKMTLDSSGNLDVTGNVTTTGSITISGAAPNLIFTETDSDPDWGILCGGGQMKFQKTNDPTANILTLDDDKIQTVVNLDILAGADVTGNLTVSGNSTLGDSNTADTVTINGSLIQNNNSSETAYASKSLPAGDSGFYIRNGDGTTGSYTSLGLIASSTGAASDQSFSIVAQAQATGLSPKVSFTQRSGNNSQNETMVFTPDGKILIGTSNQPSNKNTVTPILNVLGNGVLGAAQITRHTSVGAGGALLHLAATRGGDVNDYTILQDGDGIGSVVFKAADGNEFVSAAEVSAQVDGAPGDNDMPGRLVFKTTADGASSSTPRMTIDSSGHVFPNADNTQNLGSTTKRWANLYTGDLNLCNEGSCNEVDGTSGSWTMQEGDSDLFLINRKSGKKYKFNLTEVS